VAGVNAVIDKRQARRVEELHFRAKSGQDPRGHFDRKPGKTARTERAVKDQYAGRVGGIRAREQPVMVDAGEENIVDIG
jgi:hypothetical protein